MTALSKMLNEAKQVREESGPANRMVNAIYEGYLGEDEKWRQKKSFAPSGLFYGSGACAKRWFISFKGDIFESKVTALNVANMKNGIMSHTRIQEAMSKAGVAAALESEVVLDSPPIFGYADAVIDFEGTRYVGEIKTTNHQNFEYRRNTNKIADYHLAQVLIYMYVLDIPNGVVIYESKDTNQLHAITFRMTVEYRQLVQNILDWCMEVYKMYEDDIMPKRSFRKGSKVCKGCPVEKACDQIDGVVSVRRLSIVT